MALIKRGRWHEAIRTLGKLHRVSPKSVGLESYGKLRGFYNRQIELFKSLCKVQGGVHDVETNEPVGEIPHGDDMLEFFSQSETQPRDIGTILHGDFKIDNLIYHKTEPRVIGILE